MLGKQLGGLKALLKARFVEVIVSQGEFVWDLYDTAGYPTNIYTSKNRLTIDKISPL
jgi:hypothetical protein